MARQPYIPLYIGDWEQDVNGLSIEAEGAWLRVIFKCWRNEGSFIAPIEIIARVCKVDPQKMKMIIEEWRMNNICEIVHQPDNMIILTSRRIQREKQISVVRSETGAKGGKASRNTRTKKLYDSPGFLYLVMDLDKQGEYKVGISKDPDKRLSGIRRSYKRQNITIVFKWPVPDMGNYEDSILEYYKDVRDGEWIYMDVPPEHLRNEISSLIQKQNNSKSKPKEYQNTDIDNDNDTVIDIGIKEEEVQEKKPDSDIESILNAALGEIYLDQEKPKWPHLDFGFELETFRNKVRGSPHEYRSRDSGGIRLAFQYQLRFSKGKPKNGQSTSTNKSTEHLNSLVEGFKRRNGGANQGQ